MFSLFKKKPPEPSLADVLRLDDSAFLSTVRGAVDRGTPGAWLMCAVAMANLDVLMSTTRDLAESQSEAGLPSNIDGLIRFIVASMAKHKSDEVASRRLSWFFQAALIKRATDIGVGRADCEGDLADIWISLARGCALLPGGLADNQLWEDGEKDWFSLVTDASSGMEYCVNHIMPKALRKHPKLRAFADAEGLFLSIW